MRPTQLELDMRDLSRRASHCARLRALLRDGKWHTARELAEVGGLRYGGRLFEIRRGMDGAEPWDVEIERRPESPHSEPAWCYRLASRAR